MTSQWADLPRRLTTICVGIPILWILWSNDTLRWLFFQGTHAVICLELTFLTSNSQPPSGDLLSLVWSKRFIAQSLILSNISDPELFMLAIVGVVALETLVSTSFDVGVFFLVTIPFRSWQLTVSKSFHATVSLLLTVWNCDTGALVAGRLSKSFLRNPPPSPLWLRSISPNKSMMGLMGGLLGGVFTFVFLDWFWSTMDWFNVAPPGELCGESFSLHGVLIGLALSIAAVVGDLWESSCKRKHGVKDSGKLLPGHGGVLDRFDSSLVAVLLYPYLLPVSC